MLNNFEMILQGREVLGHGGSYEGRWVREICGTGEQSRPLLPDRGSQAPWLLLTKCLLCSGLLSQGKSRCHRSWLCVSSLVIHVLGESSGTEWLPEPPATENENFCAKSEYGAVSGCCQAQVAVSLSLCMVTFLPQQPQVYFHRAVTTCLSYSNCCPN